MDRITRIPVRQFDAYQSGPYLMWVSQTIPDTEIEPNSERAVTMKKKATKSSTKSSVKKKSKKSAKSEGVGDDTIAEMLKTVITSELLSYEVNRDGIQDILIRLASPSDNSALVVLNTVASRMQTFSDNIFKPAYDQKRMYPWIVPPVATAWFEGIFESCVMVWLQAGKPPANDKLIPHVEKFIDSQVTIFGMMIGADR